MKSNPFSYILLSLFLFLPAVNYALTIDKANEKKVLIAVNRYRAEHGWNILKPNAKMTKEAEQHSMDMAMHRIPFGHQKFDDRIKRIFVTLKAPQSGAENVAYFKKDGEETVRLWLTSSGHKRNIQGNYNLTGVGVVRDDNGWLYYTQIFARANG